MSLDKFKAKLSSILEAQDVNKLVIDDYLQEITVTHEMKVENGTQVLAKIEEFTVPALVFINDAELAEIRQKYGPLAKKGILVCIAKDFFEDLHNQDIAATRSYIKTATGHNDKIGYDWSKVLKSFVVSQSQHFSESAYKDFVADAARFVEPRYAEHAKVLRSMAQMFNNSRSTFNVKSGPFNTKREINATRAVRGKRLQMIEKEEIANLQERINQQEEQINDLEGALSQYRIQGNHSYQFHKQDLGRASVECQKLATSFLEMAKHHSPTYAAAVMNPFSIESGVRVPQVNPDPTLSLTSFDEHTLTVAAGQTVIIWGSHAATHHPAMVFNETSSFAASTVLQMALTTQPIQPGRPQMLRTQNTLSGTAVKNHFKRIVSQKLTSYGTRGRLVAGGVRYYKTTMSDQESGQMTLFNNPKGMGLGDQSTFAEVLERQDKHRLKVYTAGHTAEVVAGQIYRPQDLFDVSSYFDLKYPVYGLPQPDVVDMEDFDQPVIFATADGVWYRDPALIPNGYDVYLLFTSNVRHSYLTYITSQNPVTFEMQIRRHFECLPDIDDKILEAREELLPMEYQDAIHLLRNITEVEIYGTHEEMLQDMIYREMQLYPVVGIWSDTIVPTAKDFARWSKKIADKSGLSDFLATKAGDIALLALASVNPELAAVVKTGVNLFKNARAGDEIRPSSLIRGKNTQEAETRVLSLVDMDLSKRSNTRSLVSTGRETPNHSFIGGKSRLINHGDDYRM